MPTASIDTNVVYTTILLKFGMHPSKDLLWFSDILDARYSKKMEPREYAKLFTNGAPVLGGDAVDFELKTDAITNLKLGSTSMSRVWPALSTIRITTGHCCFVYRTRRPGTC
jgi:hypothetical protein